MLSNINIYTSDKYWGSIFSDLGAVVVDSANLADVVFNDKNIKTPVSINDLANMILNQVNNSDIIHTIFGYDVHLSNLQRRIIVLLYKNPNISIQMLKQALGITPDIASHATETAIYQLRKKYGRSIIQNTNGKYKIGHL